MNLTTEVASQDNSGTTYTAYSSPSFAATNGSLIIAIVRNGGSSTAVSSVKNSEGDSLSLDKHANYASSAVLYVCSLANTRTNSAETITMNFSTAQSDLSIIVLQFTGQHSPEVTDIETTTTGSSASPSIGSLTSAYAYEIVIAACCSVNNSAQGFTAGTIAGQTPTFNYADAASGSESLMVEGYFTASTFSSQTASFTLANSAEWVIVLVSYEGTAPALTDDDEQWRPAWVAQPDEQITLW